MEHIDLVFEMSHIEHMSTQERLLLARSRRTQQLKLWSQREKEWLRQQKIFDKSADRTISDNNYNRGVTFSDSVMLLEAASRNDIEEVKCLLLRGVNSSSTNEDGLTALHQCCIDDNEEMMKLLIEFGADVNAEDSEKWTPLHAAATCGHLHLVRYLINSGANLLAVNADGNMPYDICEDEEVLDYIESEMARYGITQELIDETRASAETRMLRDLQTAIMHGHDLEYTDEQNATLLHIASANGYSRVVEYLLEKNVPVDANDSDGWQPVHAAACWGHVEVVELLVQQGADLNARTKHNETPADICEDSELKDRIMQLKSEQESKRLQEAQKRRIKRTQSNNTRTRSVRRTSIRDKILTSKKDAVEEARLRLQAQDVSVKNVPNSGTDFDISLEYQTLPEGDPAKCNTSNENWSILRKEPEGEDSSTHVKPVNPDMCKVLPIGLPSGTSYNTDDNGKINIHVSVTINASTLAELKKQRAQNRNSSPDISFYPTFNQQIVPFTENTNSEVIPVKRYVGNTGDNLIGDPKSTRCCVVL